MPFIAEKREERRGGEKKFSILPFVLNDLSCWLPTALNNSLNEELKNEWNYLELEINLASFRKRVDGATYLSNPPLSTRGSL